MTASSALGCTLRQFLPEDVAEVAEIEASVSKEPWSAALFDGEFAVAPTTRHWLVAENEDRIVGFGGMMYVADEAHLMNVAVRPDQQRTGVASLLCRGLLLEAQRRGTTAVTLEVRVSNQPARELYRRLGFGPVGSRKNYYTNPDGSSEDALVLWLHNLAELALQASP